MLPNCGFQYKQLPTKELRKHQNEYNKHNVKNIYLDNTVINYNELNYLLNGLSCSNLDLDGLFLQNNQFGPVGFYLISDYQNLCSSNFSKTGYWQVTHKIRHIDLSNNNGGNEGAKYFANSLKENYLPGLQSINLSSNNIGDEGAEAISTALVQGSAENLKVVDLSGNNITKKGHTHIIQAMEEPSFPDVAIVLKTIKKSYEVSTEGLKTAWNFIVKGLRYTVQEHAKNQIGTKWDINKVRSNQDIDKWQSCKDTGMNVGMGIIEGLVKCSTLSPVKDPYSMFICTSANGAMGLANSDTVWCIVEIKDAIEEVDIIGDCCIC